ncbi:MAG: metallophosphoesterase, partial [Paramuribaculum sp.]|nr:metallophosphoesterase [Paramuribaculum sp.]
SGHTHAMQMEVGGISPACFRYDTWGGLYNDSEGSHPLYVNIGVGTVGMPMRLGATPEITVLTLRKKK